MDRCLAAANFVCARARVADHRLRSGELEPREADRVDVSAREIAGWPLRVLTPQDREWRFTARTSAPSIDHWIAPDTITARPVADVLVIDDLDTLTSRPVVDVLSGMRAWARTTGQAIVVTLPEVPFVEDGWLSPSIRRETDVAVRLRRPDMHDPDSARAGEVDLDVLGHRHGPTARIVAAFEGHYRQFADLRPSSERPTTARWPCLPTTRARRTPADG